MTVRTTFRMSVRPLLIAVPFPPENYDVEIVFKFLACLSNTLGKYVLLYSSKRMSSEYSSNASARCVLMSFTMFLSSVTFLASSVMLKSHDPMHSLMYWVELCFFR